MLKTAATVALLSQMVLVAEGTATRYNPGVMDSAVANRLMYGQITRQQLARAQGFIALRDCKYIGRFAWLEWPNEHISGPHLVVDCAAEKDYPRLDFLNFAVDVSYSLAEQNFPNVDMPVRGVKVYIEAKGENHARDFERSIGHVSLPDNAVHAAY